MTSLFVRAPARQPAVSPCRPRIRGCAPCATPPSAPPPAGPPDGGEPRSGGRAGAPSATLLVDPVSLGRAARGALDDAWRRLLQVGYITRRGDDAAALELDRWRGGEAGAGEAGEGERRATVLVVGATGRVGTVLVRKLSLRGYTVRALVRSTAAATRLPAGVQLVVGDVGDAAVCASAVAGCSKVVVCAAARTSVAADLANVEKRGVANLLKAMMDARNVAALKSGRRAAEAGVAKRLLFKFKTPADIFPWRVDAAGGAAAEVARQLRVAPSRSQVGFAESESGSELQWQGFVYGRGSSQVSAPLGAGVLTGCDGLTMRAKGDGRKRFACLLRVGGGSRSDGAAAAADAPGRWYSSPFTPRAAFAPHRLAFSSFRPVDNSPDAPPLDPSLVTRVGFRFDVRSQPPPSPAAAAAAAAAAAGQSLGAKQQQQQQQQQQQRGGMSRGRGALDLMAELALARRGNDDDDEYGSRARQQGGGGRGGGGGAAGAPDGDANAFSLSIAFLKALPGGAEPDFIFVSCAGVVASTSPGGGFAPPPPPPANDEALSLGEAFEAGEIDPAADAARIGDAKRGAEALLRNSGLGYTVLRPGALVDSPGGGDALVLDQSGRLTGNITAADVADVCLKAMHDPGARNTSFDVVAERAANTVGFEKIGTLPSGKNNYLAPALASLEKNT